MIARPFRRIPGFFDKVSVLLGLLAVILSFRPLAVGASPETRYQVIKDLGALNGVALQCGYIEEVRRMKQAVVLNVPKERSYGLAFDDSTNASFLAFIQEQRSCPHRDNFHRQVGHQIDEVRETFAAE